MIDPRRSLELLDPEKERLRARLAGLTDADLVRPSNLPDWTLADLAVHITRVSDSILLAVKRSTYGDTTPAFGPAAKPREDEIRAMLPVDWGDLYEQNVEELTALVNGLSDPQMDTFTFPHPQGVRPVRWYCTQILAESTFHRWDLDTSLGYRGPLDEELAAYLLPFLLDTDRHLFAARRAPAGEPVTFALTVGDTHYALSCTPEGTTVRVTAAPDGEVIDASAGVLALALYGRIPVQGSAFTATPEAARLFSTIFGPG